MSGSIDLPDSEVAISESDAGLRYHRVILKLSGEAVMGEASSPIDHDVLDFMARQVSRVVSLGVQVAVVIGGGNIWRGEVASSRGMERATADYMGMLATVINGLALQASLERHGLHTRVQSAINMVEDSSQLLDVPSDDWRRAASDRDSEKGRWWHGFQRRHLGLADSCCDDLGCCSSSNCC